MVLRGTVHRGEGERTIEGDEAPVVRRCQRKKIGVRDLAWAVEAAAVHDPWVEQADIAVPELVMTAVARPAQQVNGLGR